MKNTDFPDDRYGNIPAMNTDDFMKHALALALRGMGKTSPNPSVGAVIVRDGKIIAEGITKPCGFDHAEVTAIKAAGEAVRGSEMYVTLEPCCHYGKTPPCTRAIIEAGIRRVHIPLLDPNPRVSGQGVIALRDAGVEVIFHSEYAGYAADLIRPFKKYILRKRPFVILKLAITLDGHTATEQGDSKWISNEYSRFVVHRMRSLCDGIIVGKNTIGADNPSLGIRFDEFSDVVKEAFRKNSFTISGSDNFMLRSLLGEGNEFSDGRNPLRILFGIPDCMDRTSKVFRDENYIIFDAERNRQKLLDGHNDSGVLKKDYDEGRLFFLPDASSSEQVSAALDVLGQRGLLLTILEGGAKLAGSFYDAGDIDQFVFFIAPKILGGGRPAMIAKSPLKMAESLQLKDASTVVLQDDLMVWGYAREFNFESF